MRHVPQMCALSFVLAAAWSAANADVEVHKRGGTGTFSVDRLQLVSGEWEVEITAWGDQSDPILIGVEGEDGDVIRYVEVASVEEDPGDYVRLAVSAPNPQEELERVREVTRVPNGGPDPDGYLYIEEVVAEHVGDESTSPGGLIAARFIDRVIASGDITATITTEGGSQTEIGEVSAGGDLLGDVFTEQGIVPPVSVRSALSTLVGRSEPRLIPSSSTPI